MLECLMVLLLLRWFSGEGGIKAERLGLGRG